MADLEDRVDNRLREYAERWRADQLAPGVDLEHLGSSKRPRAGWWLVAAAAAVVVAIIVGLQIGHLGPRAVPPTTKNLNAPVPWDSLLPTGPHIPISTVPPTPDPARAAAAPSCRPSDLKVKSDTIDGAGGTLYLNVELVTIGGSPCHVQGFPDILVMDHGRRVEVPLLRGVLNPIYRAPVLVTKTVPAVLSLAWSTNWCATPFDNDRIRALLPDGGALSFHGFGRSSSCDGIPGSSPTPLRVSSFQPSARRQARTRSAYAWVRATWDAPTTAVVGQTIHFTVTLTSMRRLVLDPCPDHTISVFQSHRSYVKNFGLNCAAVPFKDSQGRPYLPAGRPVSFAMEAPVTEQGPAKFLWQLRTPDRTVHLDDSLTVVPAASPSR